MGLRTDMFTAAGMSGLVMETWNWIFSLRLGQVSDNGQVFNPADTIQSPEGLDDSCAVTDVLIERVLWIRSSKRRRKGLVSSHLILSDDRSQRDLILLQLNLLSNGNILGLEKNIFNYIILRGKKASKTI